MENSEINMRDFRYLTDIQRRYYDFIRAYISTHRTSPTYKVIADNFDVNASTVTRMISKLTRADVIDRPPGANRRIIVKNLMFKETRHYNVTFGGFAAYRSMKSSGVKSTSKT